MEVIGSVAGRRHTAAMIVKDVDSSNSDESDEADGEFVDELTPDMVGVWLVTTRHSTHVWNLDVAGGTYERRPGPAGQTMPYDGQPMPVRVGRWPAIGDRALVYYDDPDAPGWECYRMCSTIASIRRLDVRDSSAAPGASDYAPEGSAG